MCAAEDTFSSVLSEEGVVDILGFEEFRVLGGFF
jgi:hypothetical protein